MQRLTLGALILAATLSGCALNVPSYSPRYEVIDQLKKKSINKLSVGDFQPVDPKADVNRITLRGSPLQPESGTYADYLENALRSDLSEIGVYDPASGTRLDATLLKNDIDVSGFSTATGVISVRLNVSQQSKQVFEKIYMANIQFDSSFVGAVAIPRGQAEYPNLVRTLLQQIYLDSAFIEAVKKP
ncbi:MAG: hypothetical protein ABL877_03880 [Thiobacillus sp.]